MSFLRDFGAAFASNIGAEMYQREEEERRIKLEDELERRRFARRHNMEAKVALPEETPYGLPVQRGPGNWEQPTRIARRALLDEATGDVIEPARWDEGPSIPVPAPVRKFKESKRVSGDDLVTYRVYEDGSEDEIDRGPRATGGRGGGSAGGASAKDRFELRNIGGRVMRVNVPTGEREDLGPAAGEKSSGAGGMTEKGWREGLDSTLTSIQNADPGKLKSMIRQYGGDNVLTGDMDEDMLRETAFSVAETYWNERKPSANKPDEKPAKTEYAEAAAQVKARRPDLSDADVRAYLATKGIRP